MPSNPDQQPDPVEKSLGDQATGADVSRVDRDMSLGDQSTTGDALSSLSDLGSDLGEAIDSDLPLIDLPARYEIEGELGQGGMGAVLLATDRQLKRKVAIKRILGSMSKSKTALQRFVTEAQSIAKLNHFNIVQVHDFGRDAEGPFLVLEYVGGGSLLDKLKDGKLEVEEAVDITCQLCDGLSVAHEQGVVHRDIKPANILLTERGEPKLTDFGLARQDTADHGQTQAGAVLGTIDFMPPEQRRDATATDARSDLWSLAATTYQMITGKSPKVIRLDQLPGNLAPVIGKMLEDNPDERYATAEEFKDQLRKGLATVATTTAADLAAGICPACNAANDVSRKFCRGCRASLLEPCLSCETDNPVWEDVCGNCGSSQQEERERIHTKLSDMIETSLTLAREHKYDKSLTQLKTVQEGQHAFTEDIGQQAAKQIESITAERDEQHELRDQLVQLAAQHQKAHDYGAVVRDLEKIPVPLRTGNKIAQQLSKAQQTHDELSSLEKQIRDAVKNSRIEELLEKTTRFLELNPVHEKIQELHRQLQQRQEKTASRGAQLLEQAEQQHKQKADEAVLATLANWPAALEQPARAVELRERAADRLALIKDLKTAISAAITAAEKLSLVRQYLDLRPADNQAGELAANLRQQVAENLQEQAVKQRKQRKQLIIAGSVLVASVLVLVAGSTIRSWHKQQQAEAVVAAKKFAAEQAANEKFAAEQAANEKFAAEQAAAEKMAADKVAAEKALAEKALAEKAAAEKAAAISAALKKKDWLSVLQLDPTNSEALKMKAAEEKAAAISAALEKKDWLSVLQLDPTNSEALKMKAAEEKAAAISAALEKKDWLSVLQLDPTNSEALKMKAAAEKAAAISAALEKKDWLSVLQLDPTNSEALRLKEAAFKGHTNDVYSVAFSPDGKRIVSGSTDDTVKIWDAISGEKLQTLKGHTNTVYSVAFSPDGKRVVSGSGDTTLIIWDASSGQELQTLKGHTSSVRSVAFSPDGKRIVSGSTDKTLKIWDASSGKELQILEGHPHWVNSVAFSLDSQWIVSGSDDKTLKVWDASSGRELQTLKGHTGGVWSVAFSPDGKRIVSGSYDKTLIIWDAENGQHVRTLKGHTDYVRSVAFSPDGKRVVSGSDDKTLIIWDAENGQHVQTLEGHTDWVRSVAFSPDGKRVASGSTDNTLRIWPVSSLRP